MGSDQAKCSVFNKNSSEIALFWGLAAHFWGENPVPPTGGILL